MSEKQECEDELTFVVNNGLGYSDGEVMFSKRPDGVLGVLVSEGLEWEGTGCQHLTPDQVRALFSYLAGLVLPPINVIRARSPMGPIEFLAGESKVRLLRGGDMAHRGVWHWRITHHDSPLSSPLSLVACLIAADAELRLLAAADEAEVGR